MVSIPLVTLRGPRVILRPGRPGDEVALQAVFDAPEVARWWPSDGPGHVQAKVRNEDPDVRVWMVELDGRVVGLIQAYEEEDPQYRHAGFDLSLHPDVHGQGIGPEAIRLLARHVFAHGHHRIVIDPNAANAAAIRAYGKVGFQPVGIMRRYELDAATGEWRDGLLMDLLPEELAPEPE
jgi:aminoglycoside 6'-N-acetyltransferase